MSDQTVAKTSTWQHTTLNTDRHPWPRWDWNPQSHPESGRKSASLDRAATEVGVAYIVSNPVYQHIGNKEKLYNFRLHPTPHEICHSSQIRVFAWKILDSFLTDPHNYDVEVWVEEIWKWLWPQTLPWVTEENHKNPQSSKCIRENI